MLETIVTYCKLKQGAYEDYPFGPQPLVLKVAGKIYALINEDTISLKCDPIIAQNLREQYEAVKPGYHLNKKHWNTVSIDGSMTAEELYSMIDHSYELVVASLTKAGRAELSAL